MIEEEEPKRLEKSSPSPHPTACMALPLLQTSPLYSQGGGKEPRLSTELPEAFLLPKLFSFHCLIPTTLIAQDLIKSPQDFPAPLDFDPSFFSLGGALALCSQLP